MVDAVSIMFWFVRPSVDSFFLLIQSEFEMTNQLETCNTYYYARDNYLIIFGQIFSFTKVHSDSQMLP